MNGHETSGGRGNNIVSSPISLNYMTRLMAREVLLSNCFYDNMLSHRSTTGTRRDIVAPVCYTLFVLAYINS